MAAGRIARSARRSLVLRSDQTAVLGGLVSHSQSETEVKIPLLGDIPLLGYLFKNRTRSDTKSTLIVFITPSVIRSAEDTQRNMEAVLRKRMQGMQREQAAIFGRSDN